MRILLIGACGYVGSRLHAYLSRTHKVDSVDLELRGNPAAIKNRKADYRRVSHLRDYDAVVWMAGHSSVAACERDPWGAYDNNLTGLVEMARKLTGQPLVYASSASVYSVKAGGVDGGPHGWRFRNVYDYSKFACDHALRLLYPHAYGLRFGTVCGVSQNPRDELMVNAMVRSALERGIVEVRNPAIRRPILGMVDLCGAVGCVLGGGLMPGVYNVCSFNSTVEKIGRAVAAQLDARYVELSATPAYDFEMRSSFPAGETLQSIVEELKNEWERDSGKRCSPERSDQGQVPAVPERAPPQI